MTAQRSQRPRRSLSDRAVERLAQLLFGAMVWIGMAAAIVGALFTAAGAGGHRFAPGVLGGHVTATDLLVGGLVMAAGGWLIRKACDRAASNIGAGMRAEQERPAPALRLDYEGNLRRRRPEQPSAPVQVATDQPVPGRVFGVHRGAVSRADHPVPGRVFGGRR